MMEGFSTAFHGFISGEYDLNTFHSTWKEELHTPTLDYYFKSVKINAYLYFAIERRRKQIGLL